MILGYFSITCLSLVIILFSIYSMNKVCKESDLIIKQIVPKKIFSTEILASLIDQETGIRAYIISENKDFLDPYYRSSKQMQGYYNSLGNLNDAAISSETTSNLKEQMKLIQTFFKQQKTLVDNGKSYEAKLNLNQGKHLVDKFRVTNNILIKDIDLEINSSQSKVESTRKSQQYILTFLGILLTLGNLMFIRYIWNFMHGEIKKKNELNKKLQNLLASQEEFIANISHELKTPLNVIYATVQLFDMYCKSGSLDENRSSIIKYISSIKQNSYRLSKLINNIVDLSKIAAGFFELHLSNNNIVEVVEEIVMSITNFADSKRLKIIFDTDVEEKNIACDPEKIERIVLNLISNAIKFSDEGNIIFVEVKDKNEFVEISVKDNGIGIRQQDLNTIFDRFKQVDKALSRNSEGTGIGLSLVKSIVELHGGSIHVESKLGKGSKFTVVLPARKVMQNNILFSNKEKTIDESIRVELSDIYS